MRAKGIWILVSVLVAFGLLMSGFGCAAPAPAPAPTPTPAPAPAPAPDLSKEPYYEWKLNMYGKDKPMFHDTLVWWRDEMEKRTEGHFKVEMCWGRILGSSKEVVQLMGANVHELGYYVASYYATELPLGTVLQIPFLLPQDPYQNSRVYEYVCFHPLVQAEAAKLDIVNVYTNGVDPYMAMSVHKLQGPEDFSGRTIRASGTMGAMAKDMGAVTVYFATDELYEAFQRGMLEVIFGAVGTSVSAGLPELCEYLLDFSLGGAAICMGANKEAWESLPQWIKDIHWEVQEETHQRFADAMDKYLGEMRDDLKKQGMEIYPPSPELEAALISAGTLSYEAWLKECEGLGKGSEAKQLLKDTITFIEELTGEPFPYYSVQ